ncbi:MAG TPA: hypothetical protein VG713_16550, partial [Pirellulales bacterium]|nr:hypothetical protein [Pirellulales bacterium]
MVSDAPAFPGAPEALVSNPPELLGALAEAQSAVDSQSARYALGCVQWRGTQGQLVATDGRQILRYGGFT